MDPGDSLLDLSDVVHDDPVDHNHHPHSPSLQFHPTTNILSTLHDSFALTEQSSAHLPPQDYTVELLEREIASLLNQNASAASAALLNAAAQQRQAGMDVARASSEASSDPQPNHDVNGSLNPAFNGLVSILQAAMQARTHLEERREPLPKGDQQPPTTRKAPAFHSLTASSTREGEPSSKKRRSERSGTGESSAYLFSDDERDSDSDALGTVENRRSNSTDDHVMAYSSPPVVSNTINDIPPGPPGEFSDISDILNQFTSQFESASTHSPPDAPPVISHAQADQVDMRALPRTPAHDPASLPVLVPSNRAEPQPIASTSYVPPTPGSTQNSVRRSRESRGPGVHMCDHVNCGKTFTRRSDLARHGRIHTGERPFLCSYVGCGKTFIQRSALHVHSRVHTGEKPHCCEYPSCGKTFGDSSSLARHRRIHTGKRPYKCQDPTCEKTFTRRTTLTAHMRTHDPNWEPDPNVKYTFKGKKRKIDEEPDLAESVREISTLLQGNGAQASRNSTHRESSIEAQVASMLPEIEAALAQARSRGFQDDDDDGDDDDEDSSSGQELIMVPETIGPNTSGIRGVTEAGSVPKEVSAIARLSQASNHFNHREVEESEEDDDSDAFPQPLHARKSKEPISTGTKRKR